MRKFKVLAAPEEVCKGHRLRCILELCKEAYSYDYDATPRYGILRFLLEKELLEMHIVPDNVYSFLVKNLGFIGRVCIQSFEEQKGEDFEESLDSDTSEHNQSQE